MGHISYERVFFPKFQNLRTEISLVIGHFFRNTVRFKIREKVTNPWYNNQNFTYPTSIL